MLLRNARGRHLCLALVMCIGGAGVSSAAIDYTATGSDSDGSVSADATFTLGNGFVDVTLTNTLTGTENSIGQALSGISFDVSGVTGAHSAFTGTATQVDIASNGTVTSSSQLSGAAIPQWAVQDSKGLITLDVFLAGGKPDEMIVNSGPTYGPGGFDAHNPSIQGSAIFDLSLTGVTSSSTISNVKFEFGTGPDLVLDGTPTSGPSPVPEPTSVLLFGSVAALAGALVCRRSLRQA